MPDLPYCLHTAVGRLDQLPPFPTTQRYHAGILLVDGHVYIVGGFDESRRALDTISAFKP